MDISKLKKIREGVWELPKQDFTAYGNRFNMRVPARISATEKLIQMFLNFCFPDKHLVYTPTKQIVYYGI